ncbi:hypothetical protein FQR65_LT11022 [Abscondita terminalis]|nr:hypothetical protein FQR65_LT11022 [Abscondita terminalis]
MNGDKNSNHEEVRPKLYKKRWLILIIYMTVSICVNVQWTEYIVVADVIVDYYNISYEAVNWTNLISYLFFLICSLPTSYLIEKCGCRMIAVIGSLAVCLATWIKVASVSPTKFWLVMLSHGVIGIFQTPFLIMSPTVAANWFGPNEVSFACSIGFIGVQLGLALGYVLPPLLIRRGSVDDDLMSTNIGLAVISTMAFLLTLFVTDKPPIPPSYAAINRHQKVEYIKTIRQLIKNKPFLWILLGYAFILSIYCTLHTVLNQIVLKYYPDATKDVGIMGLSMIIAGIFGSACASHLLDRFKIFRFSVLLYSVLVTLSLIVFTYTLNINIAFPYITMATFGLFSVSFIAACTQVAIETTYPISETVVAGIMNAFGQGIAIASTYIYSSLFYKVEDIWANNSMVIICIITLLILLFTKFELKRTEVDMRKNLEKIKSPVQIATIF